MLDLLVSTDYSSYHYLFFFFNDTATTEIYTLSLHDALPILLGSGERIEADAVVDARGPGPAEALDLGWQKFVGREYRLARSEEHTSELQSQSNLVCRLLLEKKKKKQKQNRDRVYDCGVVE